MSLKIKYVIVFVCFFGVTKMVSQKGIIKYYTKALDRNIDNKPKLKAINEEIDLMTFELKYNGLQSVFKKVRSLSVSSIHSKIAQGLLGSSFQIYQFVSVKGKEALINKEIGDTLYQIDYSHRMKDWQLKNESKIIDGYVCYKAIRSEYNKRMSTYREYIAWYTPEIPIPFGPAGNGGLPGLILELRYGTRAVFVVSKIVLNPQKVKISIIKKGRRINVDEMISIYRTVRKYTKD